MKVDDYEAVAYDGEIYCIDCLPEGITVDTEEVNPVFADSEWDNYPVCASCGEIHSYVNVILPTDITVFQTEDNLILVFLDGQLHVMNRTYHQPEVVTWHLEKTLDPDDFYDLQIEAQGAILHNLQ